MLTLRTPGRRKLAAQKLGSQKLGPRKRGPWKRGPRRWRQGAALVAAAFVGLPVTLLAAGPARADVVRDSETWVLTAMHLQAAWKVSQGEGVVVAVIDSGVDPDVSDLAESVLPRSPNLTGIKTPSSNAGWGVHGTWMASLIAGHGHGEDSGSGIIGSAPESKILSIRVIADSSDPHIGQYQAESSIHGQHQLASAITYAVRHGAGVISMSLGYNAESRPVRAALQDAYDHNVVVVASAGNSGHAAGATGAGNAPYSFPADYPGVLAVAAVNGQGQVSGFSSDNLSVQVAAPGARVPAQGRDGRYWYVSGTSPACALTAGVVALIKAKYPALTDTQVISAITSSTARHTRPPSGWDKQIGFGVVDADAALTAAGRIAGARPSAASGLAETAHFGGGTAEIPAVPVAPRGPAGLALYCLLAVACLGLVALSSGRLLSARELPAEGPDEPHDGGPTRGGIARLLPPSGSAGPARHAAPRGRGHTPAGPS
jgi:subtilisin family serine protease